MHFHHPMLPFFRFSVLVLGPSPLLLGLSLLLRCSNPPQALRDILAQCRARRRHRFRIITGKGHGSTGGSTLIPAVRKALDEEAVANATSTVSYMPLTEEQRAKLPRDASVMSTSAATLSYSFNGAAFTVQLL